LSPYDGFEEQIRHDGNLVKEKLKGCKDEHTEYEIKTHNLRVYLFREVKTGNIIVLGGRKNTQSKDIHHFRKLKKGYLTFKYFTYVKQRKID